MQREAVTMRLLLEDLPPTTEPASSILVRPVVRGDLPSLGRVVHRAYRGTVDDEGETELDAIGELERTVNGKYGEFNWGASLVADVDAVPVSSTLVTSWQGFPLLAFTVTLPEWQGRGIGNLLISQSAELLGGQGFHELRLVVTRTNPAVHLYRKVGFLEYVFDV
jgi:GNAT superfamily N-acetyltransferase